MPKPGQLTSPQKFPIYYPAEAEFTNDQDVPGVPAGSVANLTFSITTRPFALVGIRLRNLYQLPPNGIIFTNDEIQPPESRVLFPPELAPWMKKLDGDQDIVVELAQQNIVIRPSNQELVTGKEGIHWHPFACPFPFRGGNNVTCRVTRRTPYPSEIEAMTVQADLIGWQYVTDADPGGHPPSTGFP